MLGALLLALLCWCGVVVLLVMVMMVLLIPMGRVRLAVVAMVLLWLCHAEILSVSQWIERARGLRVHGGA